MRRKHAEVYRQLAEEASPHLLGTGQGDWLARLDREHDNLRASLEWARERRDAETGLRISTGLWRFWWTRGYLSEGRAWFDVFLRQTDDAESGLLATALSGAGILAWAQGDGETANAFHQRALTAWRELGDPFGEAKALNNLGLVALDQGRYSDAIRLYEESLALHREVGNRRSVAGALLNFASVLLLERQWERAETILNETLNIYRELDDTWGVADTLRYIGAMELEIGDAPQAVVSFREALLHFHSIGDQPGTAVCLEYLACTSAAFGDAHGAARLHGAATAIRTERGIPLPASMHETVERMIAAASAQIGQEQFEADVQAARSLPVSDLVCAAAGEASRHPS